MNNYVYIVGNLGSDPKVFGDKDSQKTISINVAQNINRFNETNKKYEIIHTNWFQVKAFGNLGARVSETLKKGDHVSIVGKLKAFSYQADDGREVRGVEIIADEILKSEILSVLKRKKENEPNGEDFVDFE